MNLSFSREPALYLGALQAIVGLVIVFGVHITSEQAGAIMAVAAAVAAIIVRQNVYAPVDKDGTPIAVVK
jgi:urea transporter